MFVPVKQPHQLFISTVSKFSAAHWRTLIQPELVHRQIRTGVLAVSQAETKIQRRDHRTGSSVHSQSKPSPTKHLFHVHLPVSTQAFTHIWTSTCVQSHAELKRLCTDFLLGRAEGQKRTRRRTWARKEETRKQCALEYFGIEVSGPSFGRVCGEPRAGIGGNTRGRLSIWGKSCAALIETRTHRTNTTLNTCQGTGGGSNNKTFPDNVGTSWHITRKHTCLTWM